LKGRISTPLATVGRASVFDPSQTFSAGVQFRASGLAAWLER
jgi:hypothetical protein